MGEFANYALEETMEAEDDRFLYRIGGMSDAEAYDLGIVDELGFYEHKPMFSISTKQKTCKHCGESGLHWIESDKGWRLANKSNELHSCDKHQF